MASEERFTEELDWQKYWLVVKRRRLPAIVVFAAVLAAAGIYMLVTKPLYQSKGELLIKSSRSTSTLTGVGGDVEGELDTLTSTADTQVEVVLSAEVINAAAEKLNSQNLQPEPFTLGSISEQLAVEVVAPTDVLEVSYKAPDPEVAATVVQIIMDTYIEKGAEVRRMEATKAVSFIEQQLPKTEANVREAQEAIRQFSVANQFSKLEDEKANAVQILAQLDQQVSDTRGQLANSESQTAELRNQLGMSAQEALTATALRQSPGVQSVLTQLQEAEAKLALDKTRFRSNAPLVVQGQGQVNALRSLLQQRIGEVLGTEATDINLSGPIQGTGELESDVVGNFVTAEGQRLGLANQLAALEKTQSDFRARLDRFAKLEPQYGDLQRKLTAAQTSYESLLQRLQDAKAIENQNISNSRVISPARMPLTFSEPKIPLILGGATVLGTLLAVATAYALDMVDQSVKNIQEAEELFGYTVLGNIPDYRELGIEKAQKKRSERTNEVEFVVARDLPRSPVGEAYRMLKGNLTYFGSDSNVRTISITSSIPGEGKSEVAANLAITLVHLGHRVLLVDADMRRPTQHYKWGLSTQAGLSNVLVGELPLMVATHEVAPNLDVLPAGDTPRDPVQLLESRTIASLMRNFSKCYDYTILDCPPLIGTVDASLLSGLTDGSLLVVRPGVVNYNSAIAAKKHLSKGDFKILGMVLNGVKVQNEPYNYYHYYTREEVDRSLREKQAQF